jgi:hypothetical protein
MWRMGRLDRQAGEPARQLVTYRVVASGSARGASSPSPVGPGSPPPAPSCIPTAPRERPTSASSSRPQRALGSHRVARPLR